MFLDTEIQGFAFSNSGLHSACRHYFKFVLQYIENHIPIFHCSNDLDVAIYTDEQKVSHKSVIIAFGAIMSNGTEKMLSSLRSLGTRTFTLPKIVKLNGTVSGVELFRKPCFQI